MKKKKNRLVKKNKILFRSLGKAEIFIVLLLALLGFVFVGGIGTGNILSPAPAPSENIPIKPSDNSKDDSLQLKTIKFKQCGSTTAVGLLIDTSGSMVFGSKMTDLKKGLTLFTSQFPDAGVIGMVSYSEGVNNLVDFSYYKDVKSKVSTSINSLYPIGGTYSKNAFIVMKQKLDAARAKFPGHQFNLVFISDGIPETAATNSLCPGGLSGQYCSPHRSVAGACRCFAEEQDPTDIANEVKKSGVRIFTVAYVDKEDAKQDSLLQGLMRRVASSEGDYYLAPVENQVSSILAQISTKLCNDQ